MSGPVLLWEHVGAGLVEPLDEHLAEVDGELDLADFLPRLLEVNRWTGRPGDPLGAGPLLEIPVNCESYNLAYLPHVLAAHELDVPQTWEEYFAVARDVVAAPAGASAGSGSAAAASGTRCTPASRRSCGAAAGATSTPTAAPRSPTPTRSP